MDWLLATLDGIKQALGFFNDPIVRDAAGGFGVYAVSPLSAVWYVKQAKRTRKHAARPMTEWEVRAMSALVAGLLALFFGNRVAGWDVDTALNHALAVAFSLPLLLPTLMEGLERIAPAVAEDIGELPTEFRSVDTSELCASDEKDEP